MQHRNAYFGKVGMQGAESEERDLQIIWYPPQFPVTFASI